MNAILKAYEAAVSAIQEMNPYHIADCNPDIHVPNPRVNDQESAGYVLMKEIKATAIDGIDQLTGKGQFEFNESDVERFVEEHQQTDGDVPIWTADIWEAFVELQAYASGHAEDFQGMTTDNAQAILSYIEADTLKAVLTHALEVFNETLEGETDE
ncbi:MAG TPA: hypothetical protein VHK27_04990 [Gammaproteobacteria bacterium]|nr:hypothetical protein [Gammaproteobacteria bacterium]